MYLCPTEICETRQHGGAPYANHSAVAGVHRALHHCRDPGGGESLVITSLPPFLSPFLPPSLLLSNISVIHHCTLKAHTKAFKPHSY